MENIDKLPKWAQQRIGLLERKVEHLQQALDRRNGEARDGRVILNPYDEGTSLVFPTDTRVRLSLSGEKHRGYFDVRHVERDNAIEVHSSGGMLILPHVTNVISLKLVD